MGICIIADIEIGEKIENYFMKVCLVFGSLSLGNKLYRVGVYSFPSQEFVMDF